MPKLDVSRRRADRLLGRLRQRAAHQGQPQRDAVRHAGRRARRGGARRRPRSATSSPATRRPGARSDIGQRPQAACATSSRCGRSSARCSASALGGLDMWMNTLFALLAVRHAQARQARCRDAEAGRASASRSPIRSPTASCPSTSSPRCSCPTPTTRRISRCTCVVRDLALQKKSEHDVYAGPVAALLPGRRLRMGRGGRRGRASRSTRRTASTARPATSRTRTRTSTGSRPRAAAGRTIRTCDGGATSPTSRARCLSLPSCPGLTRASTRH